MNVVKLKVGQKIVVTKLLSIDNPKLKLGAIGTIVNIATVNPTADFSECGLTDYWLAVSQIRKYKEPKHLKLKVGDDVKIRNYKKYPELCVDSNRDYLPSMEQFIGTTAKVEYVHSDGSVLLDNGWNYCTPTLKRVKAPKAKEITIGSKVRVTALRGLDSVCYGINVGDVYTVVKVHSDGDVNIELPTGSARCMFKDQIELVS